jgi:hypothetical protein
MVSAGLEDPSTPGLAKIKGKLSSTLPNQRKNVKRSTNWAIGWLVEKSPRFENSSIFL